MEHIHGGVYPDNSIMHDFSVNLNPLGCPERVLSAIEKSSRYAERYPDPGAKALTCRIAEKLCILPDEVVVGSGASELIMAAVHAIRPGKVIIPTPSFYGYERAAIALGAEVIYYETDEDSGFVPDEGIAELITGETLVFIAHPGNPSGRYIPEDVLGKILCRCGEVKAPVICDECFTELSDRGGDASLTGMHSQYPELLVLRSFTKTYAMPGIRLGYMVGSDRALLERIRMNLPEWNVSVTAQMAGEAALLESGYAEKARQLICRERSYLAEGLEKAGLRVFSSDTCYILFSCSKPDLKERLAECGILIRDCSNFRGLGEGYYRIAVKQHPENELLIREIERIMNERD